MKSAASSIPSILIVLSLVLLSVPVLVPVEAQTSGTTTRVSVASDGTQGDDLSWRASISADGRYVAFDSSAENLAEGASLHGYHVFVHDRQTGQTNLVSVASDGTPADGASYESTISADGRFVAFTSTGCNLVPEYCNYRFHIYVYDQETGQTERVSVASDGSLGNEDSFLPSLSADGRFVSFKSQASNLVTGDTNGWEDIFVHDRQTGQTTRVSVASDGTQGNGSSSGGSFSADGRYVRFSSSASNLVTGDTNGYIDVFVRDRQTGQTTRVSVASDGTQGNGSSGGGSGGRALSADGRFVAFGSEASNLVTGDTNGYLDGFVHDRQTGQTTRVSVASDGTQGNGNGGGNSISADGRFVTFSSEASNLVTGDTRQHRDVFVHDRQTGQTNLVSVASDGVQGNDDSVSASLSADGRYVAFWSQASNLVTGDTNGCTDVFVHDRGSAELTYTISGRVTDSGEQGIPDVTVSTGAYSATTDADGNYALTQLPAGNYTLTPAKAECTFYPTTQMATVPPDATGQDFMGSCTGTIHWTVMYYQAGDSTIEGGGDFGDSMLYQTTQLKDGSNNPNVNVAVFRDTLSADAVYEAYVDGELVESISKGEPNTGSPGTLSDFVNWAKGNYPATHYALVMFGHGHGLKGSMQDLTNTSLPDGDFLDPQEFRMALLGSGPVDVLYMESCLMANLEYAYQARDQVQYYVASEAQVIGPANHAYLDYISIVTGARDLAEMMARAYEFQFEDPDSRERTISVGDMSKIELVAQRTRELAATTRAYYFDPLGRAIWNIISSDVVQRFPDNEKNVLADLYHFAQLTGGLGAADLSTAANNLMAAIDDYIVWEPEEWTGDDRWDFSNAHGVSVILTTEPLCYYTAEWFDFAGGVYWALCPLSALAEVDALGAEEYEWGQMLSDLIEEYNPDAEPQYEPPPLVPVDIPSLEVAIAIQPSGHPSSVRCTNDKATIEVAILTTDSFDALRVDHTTVTFEGATETRVDRKTGLPKRYEEDIDGDGDLDLVFNFRFGDTTLTCDSTEGTLIGQTFDGMAIQGTARIRIVGK